MGKHSVYLNGEGEKALLFLKKYFKKQGIILKNSQAIGSALIFYKDYLNQKIIDDEEENKIE